MSRIFYAGWLLLALLLFVAALFFVLANQSLVSVNFLAPGFIVEARLGVIALVIFISGLALGAVTGFGLRALLKIVRPLK